MTERIRRQKENQRNEIPRRVDQRQKADPPESGDGIFLEKRALQKPFSDQKQLDEDRQHRHGRQPKENRSDQPQGFFLREGGLDDAGTAQNADDER